MDQLFPGSKELSMSMRADPDDRSVADPRKTAPISAEAYSEYVREPSCDELWPDPRRIARRSAPPPAPKSHSPIFAAIVAILIGIMALIGLREKIVRFAPAAANVYAALGLPVNLAGLDLRSVRARIVMEGARKVLAIEGEIVNLRRNANPVPQVALTVRGEDGRDQYAWTTRAPKPKLEPGETMPFRARLASPPEKGADVLVRFAGI